MIIPFRKLALFSIASLILISACQSQPETPAPRVETPALPASAQATPTAPAEDFLTAKTSQPALPSIEADNPLCAPAEGNLLLSRCEGGSLIITRAEDARRLNIFQNQDVPFVADALSFKIEVISQPPEGQPLDHNQYGIYFTDRAGLAHAVRIFGQFFNFETWTLTDLPKIETRYNRVFSPLLKPAGQSNFIHLMCTGDSCEVRINGEMAGRISQGTAGSITRVGIFSAADWDQNFGQVAFKGVEISDLEPAALAPAPYLLMDDLTANREVFSNSGLSGAFSEYDADGFHFSPLVPFKFYSAHTGPSFADVSIEAAIRMEIEPGVSGSQFAGVTCRSSQEGAYLALIKVDGTYTVFRDTPQRPLAVLARKPSEAILPGRSVNRLRLDCHGNQIDFYINGTLVESLTDTRYNVSFGRAGLYTKAGGSPDPDAIIFSDLTIKELRQE